MDWLKLLLGENLFNLLFSKADDDVKKQITAKFEGKKFIEDDGKLIPKSRFDEVNNKKSDLEKELAASKENLTKVKADLASAVKEKENGVKTVEDKLKEITDKLANVEKTNAEKEAQLVLSSKRSVVENILRGLKANEAYIPTLVREFEAKHPLEKLEIVDGKIKDADSILKPFQENYKVMFGEIKVQGNPPNRGAGNASGDYYTHEQIAAMSQAEVSANLDKVNKSLANNT